jgi:tetratricopeptide (TPR) repeat protein
MNTFVKVNIAVNYRKADEALRLLEQARKDNAYNRFPILDYELATAYYLKLEPEAINYFQKFANRFTGKMFVKDAWQKMALSYYLKGDMKQADACRNKILQTGSLQTDADKQAQRFAEGSEWPNAQLLQVRLLIDGGYYSTALKKISAVNENSFSSISDKLEYNFRLARIYDELGDEAKALAYYRNTTAKGTGRKEQFAARAALQIGFLYERMNMRQEALAAYRQCLNMKNHDFQNSIDQQAKSGINRLSGE